MVRFRFLTGVFQEYGVLDRLLLSLTATFYKWRGSLVPSGLPFVTDSLIADIIYSRSHALWYKDHRIKFLLFADDVVLFALLSQDRKSSLEQFKVKFKVEEVGDKNQHV